MPPTVRPDHPRPPSPGPPPGSSFRIVLATTFAAFCAFYAPQPLLPAFAAEFGAAPSTVALLLTVCFVALAVAPLGFGVVLERFSARRLLVVAAAALGLLQLAFAAADGIGALLGARALQGLLYPAIFTAAVTYCSRAGDANAVARRVATYIATTITGGLCGRLIGGFASDALGWRATFALLGLVLIACAAALQLGVRDQELPAARGGAGASLRILRTPAFAAGYALIFLVFFTFSGLLNALPFRLVDVDPDARPSTISLVYLGYLVGVGISLSVARVHAALGGEVRAMGAALALFAAGLVLSDVRSVAVLVGAGFLTSAGMFTVHATLSGYLNGLRPDAASLVNGLYISIYYAAGALGSVVPLAVYQGAGWETFLATALTTCVAGTIPLVLLARTGRRADR